MSARVSIIIPSLNSPIIDRVLEAALAQSSQHEGSCVIVVGKDDHKLLPETEGYTFIDTGSPVGAASARNKGIAATDADVMVFLDSDCIPMHGWLSGHLAAQEAGHEAVSGGIAATGDNYWHLVYNLTLFHELLTLVPPGPRDFLATLNLSVSRSAIESAGVMDDNIDRVEDVDWTTRMRKSGIQPYFWPSAAVVHAHNRRNLASVWQDCALSGYHMRQLRMKHAGWLQAPPLLRYRRLVLLLSPLIATWATMRIVLNHPVILGRFPLTLPGIYLTKIAWCWGASRGKAPG